MGYFSNGIEGELYREQWCEQCVHDVSEEGCCSVWAFHLMWNYDAVGKDADGTKGVVLNTFIPIDGIVHENQKG